MSSRYACRRSTARMRRSDAIAPVSRVTAVAAAITMHGGIHRIRAHRRVRIEIMEPGDGALGAEGREIALAVDACELFVRRRRRLVVLEVTVEPRADEAVVDGPEPVGTLGVIRPHVVKQRGRMRDVGGRHGACLEFGMAWER